MSDCPIDNYDDMTVGEVADAVAPYTNGIESLSDPDVVERLDIIEAVLEYERDGKDRKTAKGSIIEVRDELKDEAVDRELVTREEEADVNGDIETPDEGDDSDSEDDNPEPDDGDVDAENEAPGSEVEDEDEASEFVGNDGTTRALIRNPDREGKNAADFSWGAGEVKDVVMNDRIRAALRRNELQLVSNST